MEYYPDTLHMRAYIAGGFSEPPSASVGDLVIWLLIFLKKKLFPLFLLFIILFSLFPLKSHNTNTDIHKDISTLTF
jgi:hypothetical protein